MDTWRTGYGFRKYAYMYGTLFSTVAASQITRIRSSSHIELDSCFSHSVSEGACGVRTDSKSLQQIKLRTHTQLMVYERKFTKSLCAVDDSAHAESCWPIHLIIPKYLRVFYKYSAHAVIRKYAGDLRTCSTPGKTFVVVACLLRRNGWRRLGRCRGCA